MTWFYVVHVEFVISGTCAQVMWRAAAGHSVKATNGDDDDDWETDPDFVVSRLLIIFVYVYKFV